MEGNGPPLVLQHGYSDSLESWYEFGYVEPLKSERQVILIDARGHGASDKPRDASQYTKELQAADIVAVLQNLSISRADYWGYSMGGQIGFTMAQYAPDWLRGLVIGGAAGSGLSRAGDRFLAALEAGGAGAIPALWGVALPRRFKLDCLRMMSKPLRLVEPIAPGLQLFYRQSRNRAFCTPVPLIQIAQQRKLPPRRCQMPLSSQFQVLCTRKVMFRSELVLPRIVEFLNSLEKQDTIPPT